MTDLISREAAIALAKVLPSHKASLSIEHNKHLDYYRTAEEEILTGSSYYHPDDFPEGELEKCIATNELWTLHWYPDTPVGFCLIHASTLEALLQAAAKDKS